MSVCPPHLLFACRIPRQRLLYSFVILLSLYYIIIISYIFKFVNMGNHMRALTRRIALEECQSEEGFPGCLRARRAQINKILWRIWASAASQFRELGNSYEGQLSTAKNAIQGCVGLVGLCPVVSAPPLYHTFIKLSSTFYKKNKRRSRLLFLLFFKIYIHKIMWELTIKNHI